MKCDRCGKKTYKKLLIFIVVPEELPFYHYMCNNCMHELYNFLNNTKSCNRECTKEKTLCKKYNNSSHEWETVVYAEEDGNQK